MKKSRRPLLCPIDTRALSAVTGGGLYEWLGLGDVNIVPGAGGDRTTSAGKDAERQAAESRH